MKHLADLVLLFFLLAVLVLLSGCQVKKKSNESWETADLNLVKEKVFGLKAASTQTLNWVYFDDVEAAFGTDYTVSQLSATAYVVTYRIPHSGGSCRLLDGSSAPDAECWTDVRMIIGKGRLERFTAISMSTSGKHAEVEVMVM